MAEEPYNCIAVKPYNLITVKPYNRKKILWDCFTYIR